MTPQSLKQVDTRLLINVLVLCLLFFVLLNFYFVYQMKGALKSAPGSTPALPAVELTILTTPECTDCFDIESIARTIRRAKINITKENQLAWNSKEAANLIQQGNLTHAPALVLSGQVQDLFMEPLKPRGELLVFDVANPPYIDLATGTVQGRASLTLIEAKGCERCFNISTVLDQIQTIVRVTSVKRMMYKDPASKALIKKYNISRIPAVILSKDAELYPVVNRSWNSLGTWEPDGSMVLRQTPPPYIDSETGNLVGLITITYLTDDSCTECYNVSIHKAVLSQLGLAFGNEILVDVSSPQGKELVKRYTIKSAPTILLPKDADRYPLLDQIWAQVGTIEDDGTHVFRTLEALGPVHWRDLSTGKVTGTQTIVVNMTGNTSSMTGGNEK